MNIDQNKHNLRPNILQYIKVPTWAASSCGLFNIDRISKSMICAGGGAKDACQGNDIECVHIQFRNKTEHSKIEFVCLFFD